MILGFLENLTKNLILDVSFSDIVIQRVLFSVAPAQADIFAKNGNKIGKIIRIFGEVDLAKNWGVICQT
jgi:rRNA processing protein Gar1